MLCYALRKSIRMYCWRQVQCMLVPLPGLEVATRSACNLLCFQCCTSNAIAFVASKLPLHPVSSVSTPRRLVYGFSGAPEVAAPGSGLLPPSALGQPAHVLTQQHRPRWPPGPLFGQADAHKQSKSAAAPQSRGYMHRQQYHAHAQPITRHAMYSDMQHPYFGPLPAAHHQQHMYQSGQQMNARPKQQYVSSGPVPPRGQSTHTFGGQRPSGVYPRVSPSYQP